MIRQSQPSHWALDKDVKACGACLDEFTVRKRKHHCRNCGQIFCADCTSRRLTLINLGLKVPSRICEGCYLELTNEDKRQIAEDLDAKDKMIDSLKRALHQKVLLLDEVKSILSQLVESSQTSTHHGEGSERESSGLIDSRQDDDSDEDDEDESVEWHLKHLQQTFAEMSKALESATATNHRMCQVQEHLQEELNHRDVYIQKIKEDHVAEITAYRAEVAKRQSEINLLSASTTQGNTAPTEASTQTSSRYYSKPADDLEASTESLTSPGTVRSQRRARSMCDLLSEIVCWPIQAMHDVMHPSPRSSSHSRLPPTVIGDPDVGGSHEDCWQNLNVHSPPQHGTCCQRRRKRRSPEPSLLSDRLL